MLKPIGFCVCVLCALCVVVQKYLESGICSLQPWEMECTQATTFNNHLRHFILHAINVHMACIVVCAGYTYAVMCRNIWALYLHLFPPILIEEIRKRLGFTRKISYRVVLNKAPWTGWFYLFNIKGNFPFFLQSLIYI